jgi:hypothetical protein
MPASPTSVIRFLQFVVAIVMMGGSLAGAPAMTEARQDDRGPDLAALILHSDDLNWLLDEMGMLFDDGYPYGLGYSTSHTAIEEAVANVDYAIGRGGFSLGQLDGEEATEILDDAGWVRSQDEFLVLPASEDKDDRRWSLGVAVTIEEFATEDGAELALRTFDNEEMLAEIALATNAERLDLPAAFDDTPAAMWRLETTRFAEVGTTEIVSMWVQVDNLVVSVALLHAPGYIAPDPELLVPLVELQLKRLEHAEHLYQPQLADCTPQLGGDQVVDQRASYTVLNGQAFPTQNMTFADLGEQQQEIDEQGIVDAFFVSQSVDETDVGVYDGTMWFAGRSRYFVDEAHAEEYLASTSTLLEEDGFTEIEEIANVPDLADGAVAYTYLGVDGYAAAVIYVQVGVETFQIRIGSTTEPQIDAVFDLAEEHVERISDGSCAENLPVPRGL